MKFQYSQGLMGDHPSEHISVESINDVRNILIEDGFDGISKKTLTCSFYTTINNYLASWDEIWVIKSDKLIIGYSNGPLK